MKKILLTLTAVAFAYVAVSQAVVQGISPASVQTNFEFGVQGGAGGWPGQQNDGTWGFDGSGVNFNNPGEFIQDTLMLVEDGIPGINAQGIDSTHEGCNELINDLTGKIAVVYRNTCYFSAKVFYAEQAGALAVVVINREDAVINMAANTDEVNGPLGTACTIPAVFISSIDGAILRSAMDNGPVELLIGNKLGANEHDIGSTASSVLSPRYGSIPSNMANMGHSFEVGLQSVNFGSEDNTAIVTVTVEGPEGNVYNESISSFIASGDTLDIFPQSELSFPSVAPGVWPEGDYTLTYTIEIEGQVDQSDYDNVFVRNFAVTSNILSLAGQENGNIKVNSFPRTAFDENEDDQYRACMVLQEVYPSVTYGIQGVYVALEASDTIADGTLLEGTEIELEILEWNDPWTGIGESWDNITFNSLNQAAFGIYTPLSDDENGQVVYIPLSQGIPLADNQRYLVCVTTYQENIAFGYDNSLNYDANFSIYDQPISPIQIDFGQPAATNPANGYYTGWNGVSALGLGLVLKANAGLEEITGISGSAFPNPATDMVTIDIDGEGPASVIVSDISGRIAYTNNVTLSNGQSSFDISSLDNGVYMFNVTLENGSTSTFSVVKK